MNRGYHDVSVVTFMVGMVISRTQSVKSNILIYEYIKY